MADEYVWIQVTVILYTLLIYVVETCSTIHFFFVCNCSKRNYLRYDRYELIHLCQI